MIFLSGLTASDDAGGILHPNDPAAQSEVIVERMRELLAVLGAEPSDAVRLNTWYRADNPPEVWEDGVRVRAAFFPEPGPVATAIPVHTLQPEGAAIVLRADRRVDKRRQIDVGLGLPAPGLDLAPQPGHHRAYRRGHRR